MFRRIDFPHSVLFKGTNGCVSGKCPPGDRLLPSERSFFPFSKTGTFLDTHGYEKEIGGGLLFEERAFSDMKTLFYSSCDDQNSKALKTAVRQVIPDGQLELFSRLDDLEERLRRPIEPDSIAVFSVSSREELQKMQSLRKLLPEIYVLLVLPDHKKSTLALAHRLLPRFLSQKDSDFADLKGVLHKMFSNSRRFQQGELLREA